MTNTALDELERWLSCNATIVDIPSGVVYQHPDFEKWTAALRALRQENARMVGLLTRLHQWDMMDSSADGKYWRAEIEALANLDATDSQK